MTRLAAQLVLASSLAGAAVVFADVRPLSDAEKQALFSVSRTEDFVDAYAETDNGETLLRYAIMIYRGRPLSDGACIATTVDYMAPAGSEVRWEPVFDSVAYRYWPGGSECVDVTAPGSIRLDTLIDSATLGRIVRATGQVLEAAGDVPSAGDARRLVALGVAYDDIERAYVYSADYAGAKDCSAIRIHLRVRDEVEFVRVVPTTCETREYLDAIRR
jgi:hypothetical protein